MTPEALARQLAPIAAPLVDWYRQNARVLPWRENTDPYRVWVSEIMLQQTRVTAVIPYYLRFLEALPTPAALAACPEDRLMKLWEGLGYYSRARNMQKAARVMVERYGGQLPSSFEDLKALPGVGEYTAGAVASIALGLPCPAVDGNVLRVVSRLAASREDIAAPQVKKDFSAALSAVIPRDCPGDFTQALMELGACVCLPGGDPLCGGCPLWDLCRARALGIQGRLPVKAPKKARRQEEHTVFVLEREGLLPLMKRPEKGLLRGLWQPPMAAGHLDGEEARAALSAMGFLAMDLRPLPPARHIFTHVQWELVGWQARVSGDGPRDFRWFTPRALLEEAAVPTAFAAYLGGKALKGPIPR